MPPPFSLFLSVCLSVSLSSLSVSPSFHFLVHSSDVFPTHSHTRYMSLPSAPPPPPPPTRSAPAQDEVADGVAGDLHEGSGESERLRAWDIFKAWS